MNFRKLLVIGIVIFFASFSILFAEEKIDNGIELGMGVSPGDIVSGVGFVMKPVFTYDIMRSGLVIGIDTWDITLLPEGFGGEPEIFEEYGFGVGDSMLNATFGNYNVFAFADPAVIDGYIYQNLTLSAENKDVASVELDEYYLMESIGEFSLATVIGGGYEFDFNEENSLLLWADFNFDLYPLAAIDDIEFTVEYTYSPEPYFIKLTLEPTITMGETAGLSFEPSVTAGITF